MEPCGTPALTFHPFQQQLNRKYTTTKMYYLSNSLRFLSVCIPVFMLYTHTGMLVGERIRESEGRGTEK